MKLQAKTQEQRDRVEEILGKTSSWFVDYNDDGVHIDDWITYDEMAEIVDYLRQPHSKNTKLFEECWVAYRRKGCKKQSLYQWGRLNEKEQKLVLPHIKAYIGVRERQYQRDFERYLRDKIFTEVVAYGNSIVYDPNNAVQPSDGKGTAYMPRTGVALMWNETYKCYMYTGYWDGRNMADGYDDDTRPDGATITLNNGRGQIRWSSDNKRWLKI